MFGKKQKIKELTAALDAMKDKCNFLKCDVEIRDSIIKVQDSYNKCYSGGKYLHEKITYFNMFYNINFSVMSFRGKG